MKGVFYMLKKIKNSALEFKSVRSLVIIAMLLAVHTVLSIVGSVRVSDSLKISTGFVATAIMAVSYGPVVGLIFGAAGDLIQWMINPTGPLALGLTLNAALAAMVYGFTLYKKLPKKNEGEEGREKSTAEIIALRAYGVFSAVFMLSGFVMMLLAYTDRKTRVYSTGFYIGMVVNLLLGLLLAVLLIAKTGMDTLYMIRVIVCVSLINILINAVLGTFWLADLYGWDYKVYFWPRLIKNLIQIPINSIIIYFVMQAFSNNRYLRQMIGA